MPAIYLNDKRFPGGLRTGAQYIDGLKNDGRRVFIDGAEVGDVTGHPAFREAVRSIADLYDIASDPANRELMTFVSPATGDPVNRIWQLPRSQADLRARACGDCALVGGDIRANGTQPRSRRRVLCRLDDGAGSVRT